MPRYSLQFPTFTSYDLVMAECDRNGSISRNPVFAWLSYGKLAETVTVQPAYSTVTVEPSGRHYILDEVFVEPIQPSVYAVTLAAGATMTITAANVGSVVSSDTTLVTVALVNGIVTITAVAAGNAVVTVSDVNNDLMYTINVTVA